MNLLDYQANLAARALGKDADRVAMGLRKLWYVRSTGEIVGPNWGKLTGKNNKKRYAAGNLFTSEHEAEKAAKYIRLVLRFLRWLP